MGGHEWPSSIVPDGPEWRLDGELVSPHHFYAAYIFDEAESRRRDVAAVIEEARRLGYPVRYWWLSEAMDVQGSPDRLIMCVHHPARDENAGMDLYTALQEQQVIWDELEAATMDEYVLLSKAVTDPAGITRPNGTVLFPPPPAAGAPAGGF